MRPQLFALLLALQVFHVLFLLLHDWIPLGPLSDPVAVRAENSLPKLLSATLLSSLPFVIALACSLRFQILGYPHWLLRFLWIAYLFLFAGELQAWWVPYFFGAQPERVARYRTMFGTTHAFLPARNGIRINTLHVVLHAATLALLGTLAALTLTS